MHALLDELFRRRDLFRLVDGGLVDNLPARPVWGAGAGRRHRHAQHLRARAGGVRPQALAAALVRAGQIAAQTVARSRPFVNLLRSYQRVLSPLEVVPGAAALKKAVQAGRAELLPDMPLVARLCRPFPAITSSAAAARTRFAARSDPDGSDGLRHPRGIRPFWPGVVT